MANLNKERVLFDAKTMITVHEPLAASLGRTVESTEITCSLCVPLSLSQDLIKVLARGMRYLSLCAPLITDY
jgi:hypothetical protein